MNQNKLPVWRIKGLEFEYDFDDLSSVERYEKAMETMNKKSKEMPKDGNRSTQIKSYCNIMYELFDDLFGKETSTKIFKGRMNARECDEVYDSFLKFVRTNVAFTDQARINKYQKYLGKNTPPEHRKSYKGNRNRAKLSH